MRRHRGGRGARGGRRISAATRGRRAATQGGPYEGSRFKDALLVLGYFLIMVGFLIIFIGIPYAPIPMVLGFGCWALAGYRPRYAGEDK